MFTVTENAVIITSDIIINKYNQIFQSNICL